MSSDVVDLLGPILMINSADIIATIAKALGDCQSVLAITGAGVSAESGIPTYRGVSGLYNSGLTPEGFSIEEILSGEMLQSRPQLTWKYLREIAAAVGRAEPNLAHRTLAQLESVFARFCILTQNIDGFHLAAGSRDVIEIHGNLSEVICTGCHRKKLATPQLLEQLPPRCDDCDAVLRPNVVLFGEMLPAPAIARLEEELSRGVDAVFSIGTTSVFPYIQAPIRWARSRQRLTVEINPDRTAVSELVDFRLMMPAGEALSQLWHAWQGIRA